MHVILRGTKTHDPDNSEQYKYDSAYRLTSTGSGTQSANARAFERGTFTDGTRTSMSSIGFYQDWNIEAVHNWEGFWDNSGTKITSTYSDFNEIITRNSVTSVHDNNGNLTDDGTLLLEYDALNRLSEVSRKSDGLQIAEYAYDGDNRRQRKVVTNGGKDSIPALNGTTQYVYHGWRLLEERDGTGAIQKQYVYGNRLDEIWTMDDRSGGVTVAQLNDGSGAQRHFALCNVLGSITGLTDETGSLVEAWQYDAYGRHTLIADGPDGDSVVSWTADDVRTT